MRVRAVVLSDDGVNPHTVGNSLRKAYTALTTRAPSVAWAGKRPQPGPSGFLPLDKTTTIEGGLPVFAGKELLGAIGIPGAPEAKRRCVRPGGPRPGRQGSGHPRHGTAAPGKARLAAYRHLGDFNGDGKLST